ncbi:hypothetical protein HanIR_Chr15g0785341 [Helianthus annuus]|nr:hypothetical protein HanIR_Chr15g0785341 [Helianthus annuus]
MERVGPEKSYTLFELEEMCPWALTKLGIGLTIGLNLMPKGLITNLNHKNSFVRGPTLVFACVYHIKTIFYIYIPDFFHKKCAPQDIGPWPVVLPAHPQGRLRLLKKNQRTGLELNNKLEESYSSHT